MRGRIGSRCLQWEESKNGLSSLAVQIGIADGGADSSAWDGRGALPILRAVDLEPSAAGHGGVLYIRPWPMRELAVVNIIPSAWAK